MTDTSRLYRSNTDKVIGGVSGGLGDYLNIDPVVVRILFVLLAVFGGSGVLVYIILWIVIPAKSYSQQILDNQEDQKKSTEVNEPVESTRKTNTSLIAGILLIAFGLIFLFDHIFPFYHVFDLWPLLLIVAGVLLIKPEIVKSSKNIES